MEDRFREHKSVFLLRAFAAAALSAAAFSGWVLGSAWVPSEELVIAEASEGFLRGGTGASHRSVLSSDKGSEKPAGSGISRRKKTVTACLGWANLSSVSCSQVGSQCFIGGWATWRPATPNCLYAGPAMGAITAIGSGSGGPSYFDPVGGPSYPVSVPWGVLSAHCGTQNSFGAIMQVVHDTWSGGTACNCIANTPMFSQSLASTIWSCKSP